jgi:hypothetical protein
MFTHEETAGRKVVAENGTRKGTGVDLVEGSDGESSKQGMSQGASSVHAPMRLKMRLQEMTVNIFWGAWGGRSGGCFYSESFVCNNAECFGLPVLSCHHHSECYTCDQ